MFLKQLQEGHMSIFAFIIGDKKSGEGLVVDPAAESPEIITLIFNHKMTDGEPELARLC